MTDFEAIREANIKSNKALLIALGLETPVIPTKSKPKPKPKPTKNASEKGKKRKAIASSEDVTSRPSKIIKVASTGEFDAIPTRRSKRNAGKARISYNESENSSNVWIAKGRGTQLVSSAAIVASARDHEGNRLGKRLHDPKTFGAIPGVEVGTWWETRAACSTDAIHAPFVAGIAGSAVDGAYSVALSGGYDDDVDLGYAFTYTGSGGRDLKGTKANPKNLRTAPQSCDQTFDNPMNAALKRSSETKKPVRVIRGYKLDSEYAPESGYRYDGLYTVEKAWLERGLNKQGYKVCKYAFKRLAGQPSLPTREEEAAKSDEETQDIESEDENDGKESTNEEKS